MSDYIVKIIPQDQGFRVPDSIANAEAEVLRDVVQAQRVTVESHKMPRFIDCGSNLESVCCPVCGSPLEFDWWGERMESAARDDFASLEVQMPCCGKISSLNDLRYHFPCGFACTELALWNPAREPSTEDIAGIEERLGTPVRVIRAHL